MMSVEIDKRISLGNILTLATVAVLVIGGWKTMEINQTKLAEKVAEIQATVAAKTALRDRQMDEYDRRVRAVEIAQAGQTSDLRNIQIGISEIKAALNKLSQQ